jgi:hypothetical protein
VRIATYNVEWFIGLFDRRGRILDDGELSSRYNTSRHDQLHALGRVFRAMDADAVMVIEAPDHDPVRHPAPAMLEAFAERFGLRARRALLGFANETQQEIALLYDPDRLEAVHDPKGGLPGDNRAPRFDTRSEIDLNIDGRVDVLTFNKPPLEIAARTRGGRAFRMIGVHLKSKAPHGANDEADARRIAIASRREQLAQALWLRARVLEHLRAGESLMVMGDFNDGPGLDEYEKLFGRSGVEIVLGWDEPRPERLFDPHGRAALVRKLAAAPGSARFYLPEHDQYLSAMLDYIMVSPDIRAEAPRWRIWHPFDDPRIYRDSELREALLTASDHFPVTLDLCWD